MVNEYIVDKEHSDMRLDKFLRKYSKEESLALIFSFIRKGEVKVNGKKSKENYRLVLGDKLYFPDKAKVYLKEAKKVDHSNFAKYIVFEDENVFMINKPSGIPMHKGDGHEFGLSEMAKSYYNSANVNFANRIDIATEGLVIGAKNLEILRKINEEIRQKRVMKKYIAKVNRKNLKLGDKFISEKSLKTLDNKVVVDKNGSYAKSIFEVIEIEDNTAILDVELITGRKHQIRVHLSDLGYAIIGDGKYGKATKNGRMFLKCYETKFLHYDIKIEKNF